MSRSGDRVVWRVTYTCNNACQASVHNAGQQEPPTLANTDSFAQELFDYAATAAARRNRIQAPIRHSNRDPRLINRKRGRAANRRSSNDPQDNSDDAEPSSESDVTLQDDGEGSDSGPDRPECSAELIVSNFSLTFYCC